MELLNKFIESTEAFEWLELVPLERKKAIYRRLVEKAINAKLNDVMLSYQDESTGRRSKGCGDTTHRATLKAVSKGSVVLPQNRADSA